MPLWNPLSCLHPAVKYDEDARPDVPRWAPPTQRPKKHDVVVTEAGHNRLWALDLATELPALAKPQSTSGLLALDLRQPLPDPAPQCRINYAKAARWLRMHPNLGPQAGVREAARATLCNLECPSRHIYDQIFERQIGVLQRRRCKELPLVALSSVRGGSSNAWMTRRAAQHLGPETPLDLRKRPHFPGEKVEMVAFDDASYSGSQLSTGVADALQRWGRSRVSALYVVVPAMTQTAMQEVRRRANMGDQLHFVRPMIRLHTLEELKQSGALSEAAYTLINRHGPPTRTLAFVPHKVPDHVSCVARILSAGECVHQSEVYSNRGLPFIDLVPKPY